MAVSVCLYLFLVVFFKCHIIIHVNVLIEKNTLLTLIDIDIPLLSPTNLITLQIFITNQTSDDTVISKYSELHEEQSLQLFIQKTTKKESRVQQNCHLASETESVNTKWTGMEES